MSDLHELPKKWRDKRFCGAFQEGVQYCAAELEAALANEANYALELAALICTIEQFGDGASMMHPRVTRAITRAKSLLPSNTMPLPPAPENAKSAATGSERNAHE